MLLLAWLAVAAADPTPAASPSSATAQGAGTPSAIAQSASAPSKSKSSKSKAKPAATATPSDPVASPSRTPLATPENPVDVSCDNGSMNGELRQFTCKGHVKMVRNAGKPNETTVTCDRSIAYYVGKDATQVTRLECFGNVVAVAGDRWAHGDHADYDTVKEILVMTGNPEARQGNNTMHGERVVFYVDTDLIEVQNVKGTLESKGKEPGAKKSPPSTP
jgi:lipopolysaccharide export system protein LptA